MIHNKTFSYISHTFIPQLLIKPQIRIHEICVTLLESEKKSDKTQGKNIVFVHKSDFQMHKSVDNCSLLLKKMNVEFICLKNTAHI